MKQIERISDIISNDDISSWQNGNIITIEAGVGMGKSYFIKNKLYQFAKQNNKKILMLIHRKNCVDQFKEEIKKDRKEDIIKILTYQSLEKMLCNKNFDINEYGYIICDEFHYFLSDASFNKTTDVSLDIILNQQNIIKVFMSATGNEMKNYINNIKKINTIDYYIPMCYDFIDKLVFYKSSDSIDDYIDYCIKHNEKAIVFIQKSTTAYEYYKKFKDYAIFNCSKSNKYYKYVDKEQINHLLSSEKFDKPILITTTAMDSGVNIIDKSVKHIIIDVEDVNTIIQCIGRRRIDYNDINDKINVYIKNMNNCQLGGRIKQNRKYIEQADYLRNNGVMKYIEKYSRSPDTKSIVYDEIDVESNQYYKKINKLMYFKCKLDIVYMDLMIKAGNNGFINYVTSRLNNIRYEVDDIVKDKQEQQLENYLNSMVGKVMLNVEDRKELIEMINVRQNGKVLRNIDILNKSLECIESQYTIRAFSTSKTVDGKVKRYKSAWKVMRLSDN